jgi:predicted DCC family thiol-disulfide oxidoreductase YuxK
MRRDGANGEQLTLLYDEDCGFCRWSAERLRRWDRRGSLRFVPIQSAPGLSALSSLGPDARLDSWHVVGADGRLWSGGDAIPVLLRSLPGGTPIAVLAAAAPGPTDAAYRWVATQRGRLGRLLGQRACAVDPSHAERGRGP